MNIFLLIGVYLEAIPSWYVVPIVGTALFKLYCAGVGQLQLDKKVAGMWSNIKRATAVGMAVAHGTSSAASKLYFMTVLSKLPAWLPCRAGIATVILTPLKQFLIRYY